MTAKIVIGILIPFIGTSLGAAMVFFLKNEISDKLKRILTGFAALSVDTQKYFFASHSFAISIVESVLKIFVSELLTM